MKNNLVFISLFTLSSVCIGQIRQTIDQAYHHYYTKNYDSSKYYFKQLLDENPNHHDYHVKSGFSHFYLNDFEESIKSFQKAIEIGPWPDIYAYYIAASYIQVDSLETALDWLEKSVYRWKWPDYGRLRSSKFFKAVHNHPRFLSLFGETPVINDRVTGWQNDLTFAFEKIKLLHYNPYLTHSEATWQNAFNKIILAIPKLTDKEVIIEFIKFGALAGEGHTKIIPPESGKNAFTGLPIELYHFKDGTFIINTTYEYRHLYGSRIDSIGNQSMERLFDLSYQYAGHENMMHHKKVSPKYLVMTEVLKDMYAIQDITEPIQITISINGKRSKEMIRAYSLEELSNLDWYGIKPTTDQLTYFYRNREKDFWFEGISDLNAMYLNINYIINNDEMSFKEFCRVAFSVADSTHVKNLIIDLRNCGGGNSAYNRYLLDELAKRPSHNNKNNLYILIGRGTYSAAINLVSDLEYRTDATFIGEPTGSSPNFIGESNVLHLPNSKLYLVISNRYHQGGANNSLDKRPWIAPDVSAEFSSSDFFEKKDPGINWIHNNIKN